MRGFKNSQWLCWDGEIYISSKVTKMGSIISHKIGYNEVGALRGQRHIRSKNLLKEPPPPPFPGASIVGCCR